jgi:predicted SnoaL-like aldol condensation-catalyzing enzyme
MPENKKKPARKKAQPATSKPRSKRSAAGGRATSPGKNKALVRRLLEHALSEASRTNPETLHEYFADHFVDHVPIHHQLQGVHGVKDVMVELHASTQAFRMEVVHMVAEGNWVAVHWQATGTRHRKLEKHRQLKGVEPSGGERAAAGITLFHLQGGKIVESWNYDNALELAMQSGTRPAAA